MRDEADCAKGEGSQGGHEDSDSKDSAESKPVRLENMLNAEWEKVWSRLSAHLQPFFWLLVRILTIFGKKYRILTCRDKSESYLFVLQQNNV